MPKESKVAQKKRKEVMYRLRLDFASRQAKKLPSARNGAWCVVRGAWCVGNAAQVCAATEPGVPSHASHTSHSPIANKPQIKSSEIGKSTCFLANPHYANFLPGESKEDALKKTE
jgi:hypothetical protein